MANASLTNTCEYSGTLTVSLSDQGQILKTVKLHNEGREYLFSFFANCIVGDVAKINSLRPTKIRFLQKDANGKYTAASSFISMDTIAEITKTERNDSSGATINGAAARLSFRVGVPLIHGDFNYVGLYHSAATEDDISNPSAIFNISDTINSADLKQDYTDTTVILIDWELELINVNTEQKEKEIS